jgi:nucleoside-diphosphate-sugar epimerase
VVDQVDVVIQAAALIYGVGGFHKYPADILAKDIQLHTNVLEACRVHKKRKVCYISSSMVYERCQTYPSVEDDVDASLIPSTDYGLSKLVGERLSQAYWEQYGIKYVIWRPFNIITPYEMGDSEQGISHVFADYIKNIVKEKKNPLPIIGDGEQVRCFTWIKDIAHAIGKYSFDDLTDNQCYNLGNPEPITMKELACLIYKEAGRNGLILTDKELEFETTKSYKDDVLRRIPDITKAQKELNWKPTLKVQDTVRACLHHQKSLL